MAKIYVISDKPEFLIMASNRINASGNSAIISELSTFTTDAILGEIKRNLSSYDMFIVFKSGANVVSAHAGKMPGIVAAACRDSDEIGELMEAGDVNTIFIDSVKQSKDSAGEIVEGVLDNLGGSKPQKPAREPAKYQKPAPQRGPSGPPITQQVSQKVSGVFEGITSKVNRPQPDKKRSRDDEDKGESFVSSVKSRGLKNTMKDALGIKDEGEE